MDKEVNGLSSEIYSPDKITSQNVLGKQMSDALSDVYDFMGKDSPIISKYCNAEPFDIGDNAKLYDIIRIVRGLVDNQFYNQGLTTMSFGFNISVNNKLVSFILTFSNNQIGGEDAIVAFCDGFVQTVKTLINARYADTVEITSEIKQVEGDIPLSQEGKTQLTVICQEKSK